MAKRTSTKHKIDRRLGLNLWGRPKSPFNEREYGPGQHGQRRRKPTDYGIQLMAKQKLKGYYGNVSEKQFRRYHAEAVRRKGGTDENLIGILESRLDSVVYRMKFVLTIFAARQLVNHGHINVNGRRVNIPSYLLHEGDKVEIKKSSRELLAILEGVRSNERDVPAYLNVDHNKMIGTLVSVPKLEEVPYPVHMEPNLVVEFYSR
ncbi:ribosomal protein S4 [Candidatus Endolissoclinum faulkneri L5]|uniref:Small ribosomal subunit protein uS4 n=1 Tax=Candidatus Endolissoclinum faulkneri L5 TaxID=1401328 RepID=V9TSD0_9PROT|nr:30S ribosomal protein S4 [Candidatus Endolissoclinum faulkneri]AHC73496.1 ribosomal protein S4 [Candidatus Endolissoclinum faulkneri L5]